MTPEKSRCLWRISLWVRLGLRIAGAVFNEALKKGADFDLLSAAVTNGEAPVIYEAEPQVRPLQTASFKCQAKAPTPE